MKTNLHLICTPWSHPAFPSIQLGSLKAYVDREFNGSVTTRTYSSHLELLYYFKGVNFNKVFNLYGRHSENVFFVLFFKRFLQNKLQFKDNISINELLNVINSNVEERYHLTEEFVDEFDLITQDYIQSKIIPELSNDALNLIGFTLNYAQVYSSLYFAQTIIQLAPHCPKIFLYGGHNASTPEMVPLLKVHGGEGFRVVGEGEDKLKKLINSSLLYHDDLENVATSFVNSINKNIIFCLEQLIKEKILFETEGYFLSLAIRPKEELIQALNHLPQNMQKKA